MIVEGSRRQQWRCRANGGEAQPAEHVEDERLASGRRRHRHTRHTPAAGGRRPVPRGRRGQDAHRSRSCLSSAGSASNGNGAEEWQCVCAAPPPPRLPRLPLPRPSRPLLLPRTRTRRSRRCPPATRLTISPLCSSAIC